MEFETKDIFYVCFLIVVVIVGVILGKAPEPSTDRHCVLPRVQLNCTAEVEPVVIDRVIKVSSCDLQGVAKFLDENKHDTDSIDSAIAKYTK